MTATVFGDTKEDIEKLSVHGFYCLTFSTRTESSKQQSKSQEHEKFNIYYRSLYDVFGCGKLRRWL